MKCEICSSDKYVFFNKDMGKFLCGKHRAQIQRNGKISTRTRKDMNEIIIDEEKNVAKVCLYDKDGNIRNYAIIDIEDVDKIKSYKWSEANTGYATTQIDYKDIILMHRLIMSVSDRNIEVDHIDRNRLNNKKSNLRITDRQDNARNIKIQINNSSGVSGIHYDNERDKWKSQIYKGGKAIVNIRFDSFDDAVKERIKNESIYYKEFSPNYNPLTQTIQLTYLNPDTKQTMFIESNLQGEIITFQKLS